MVFGFGEGQELSEHTSSRPAVLHVLRGEAILTLGNETVEAAAGDWIHLEAHLRHAVRAKTPLVMLLLLLKG